ncbi:lymphocyte antigen 6H-like [Leptonychotes weddellii]|uniref:Lymphocyte antigen 6H-like n=1 Tax=Leptonychotes weddellii TaxID=9713 RepID=A0A7F8PWD7_LEPWE|nr:lymphocyte antigen 6H-like [Leptonychotes weddellii]XP_030872637.1 lymphocyte antigen 6H-like [Leptonychotes weddellii]
MRGIHLLLLALLLRSELALSLRCYMCVDMNNSPCQSIQCQIHSVCYTGNLTVTAEEGTQVKYQQKGCAPSCKEVSSTLKQLSEISGPGNPGVLGLVKLEVQGLMCCDKDLCNGGAQLLGPGGGLLLSLGPVFLWALL